MYVPVVTGQQNSVQDADHRDLNTALRLLSGHECKRDASQAQVLLVGLTESTHPDVAADSKAIMKAGLARGWFESTTPKIYDLEMLAETSLAKYRTGDAAQLQKKMVMLVIVGLVMFLGLGLFYFDRASSGGGESSIEPGLLIAIFVAVIAAVALAIKRSKDQ